MGLVIGESITIFSPSPQSRNDFMLMAMILLTGFALIALAATLFVEKKVNDKLLSIKHTLLYLTKDNYFADKYLAKRKIIKEPFAELADLLFQMREYFVEYEQSINKKYRTLNQREKMKALDHLSTSIAHEINNPLAGILGHAQLAKGKSVDLPLQKHLDIIEREIRKVKDFTRDLTRFSKSTPLSCKTININKIILETIGLMEKQLKDKNVQVQKRLTSNQDVYIDAIQLQQVFVNLIDNAIYAMERCQKRILTIHTEDANHGMHIRISDTGIGIPESLRNRIFEPFFTTKESQEGKGLGLSICFGIIRGHKGNIHLESETNRGSTFVIDLPYPENIENQEEMTSQNLVSEEPTNLQQKTPSVVESTTALQSKQMGSIINKPADRMEETKSSVLSKKTLADIKNPFQGDKKNSTISDLQKKLKVPDGIPKVASLQIDKIDLDLSLHESTSKTLKESQATDKQKASDDVPKMAPLQMDNIDIGLSLHKPTSQTLEESQATDKKNDTIMIHKTSAEKELKKEVDLQLNGDIEKQKLTNEEANEEKDNFFINKHDIVNKKKVEFKVKIRPPKIKEK